MSAQNFTPNHAKHLTSLVESLRPDWDRSGIADAIWKARDRGTALEVCIAAVKACVLTNRTPGVIPLDGPHWRETVHVPNGLRGTADKASHCSACGLVHTALSPCSPPDQRSHGAGAAAAREALQVALGKAGNDETEMK